MLVDILISLLFLSSLLRGREIGLIRQVFSTTGFFGGLFFGAWIEPHIVGKAHTQLSRALLTLSMTLGCALLLLFVGEYVGLSLKTKLERYRLNKADVWLGAVAGGMTTLITAWLIIPVLATLPIPGLQSAVHRSIIVSWLDTSLPQAPNVIADLSHIVNPNGFPDVFTGLEPVPPVSVRLPSIDLMQAAVAKDKASVVKIEGQGCGGIVEGSGFIAANGFVATNAHVVAGIARPFVFQGSHMERATVVWFNPNLDFAVLRVADLKGEPLRIDMAHRDRGTPGVVAGYPGGGNFSAVPAVLLDEFTATGRNIYNEGQTDREVYEVKATIIPGNSGGPLIERSGQVMGVVFAESTTYGQTGYALTTQQVVNELRQAVVADHSTSTGTCAQ